MKPANLGWTAYLMNMPKGDKVNMTKKEQLSEANDIIYSQLSYAEAKNAVLIGLVGAAIFSIVGIIVDINDPCSKLIIGIQIALGCIALQFTVALLISLFSFLPNLGKQSAVRKNNQYFYGDIATYKDAKQYVSEVDDSGDLEEQLAEQNIIVSKIIMAKYAKFKIALNITIASLIPPYYLVWAIMAICRKIMRKHSKWTNAYD